MLLPNQIQHADKGVIVNKPALQAWLHAWTTGESFPSLPSRHISFQKKEAVTLAALPRLRSRTAK
jgi:hypothetical protein